MAGGFQAQQVHRSEVARMTVSCNSAATVAFITRPSFGHERVHSRCPVRVYRQIYRGPFIGTVGLCSTNHDDLSVRGTESPLHGFAIQTDS